MTATNDRELRRAMHRMLQSVQPSPTPVDAIIQRGKKIRLRSRRRAWAAAATVAVAVVAFIIPARIGAPGHGPRSAGRQRPATDYLANQVERELTRTITPISTATNRVRRPIPGRYFPAGIAITPDGKTAYVPCYRSGIVTPISTATNTAEQPIKVGAGPVAVAFTPDGKTAYVVSLGVGTVTPISTATNRPGRPIKVGVHPYAIVIAPGVCRSRTCSPGNTRPSTPSMAALLNGP